MDMYQNLVSVFQVLSPLHHHHAQFLNQFHLHSGIHKRLMFPFHSQYKNMENALYYTSPPQLQKTQNIFVLVQSVNQYVGVIVLHTPLLLQ